MCTIIRIYIQVTAQSRIAVVRDQRRQRSSWPPGSTGGSRPCRKRRRPTQRTGQPHCARPKLVEEDPGHEPPSPCRRVQSQRGGYSAGQRGTRASTLTTRVCCRRAERGPLPHFAPSFFDTGSARCTDPQEPTAGSGRRYASAIAHLAQARSTCPRTLRRPVSHSQTVHSGRPCPRRARKGGQSRSQGCDPPLTTIPGRRHLHRSRP